MFERDKILKFLGMDVGEFWTPEEVDENLSVEFSDLDLTNHEGEPYAIFSLDDRSSGYYVRHGYTENELRDKALSKVIDILNLKEETKQP